MGEVLQARGAGQDLCVPSAFCAPSSQHSTINTCLQNMFSPSFYELSSFREDPDLYHLLSSEGHKPQLSDCLWFSGFYRGLYASYQICFSPVNLSSINLIRAPEEPRKVDEKIFLSYTSLSRIHNESEMNIGNTCMQI